MPLFNNIKNQTKVFVLVNMVMKIQIMKSRKKNQVMTKTTMVITMMT